MAWLATHTFRKEITIQDTNVDSNLTDFPVYVKIDNDADFHESRSDGYDVCFTSSDGETLLKYEREYWTGGDGNAATAHFWVKVPSILSSGGATIYCYYGDDDADNYNGSVDDDADLFGTGNYSNLTNERFGIIVLEDADSSCTRFTPVINSGDKVAITIRCGSNNNGCFGREIPERKEVFGKVIPEIGSPGVIAFTTPMAYHNQVMDLQ